MAAEKERELAGLTSVSDANRNAAGTGSRSAKPEKSESRVRSWIARHVYPQSLIDIRSPVFWKDVVLESIVSAYVLCLVLFVMVTCNKVGKLEACNNAFCSNYLGLKLDLDYIMSCMVGLFRFRLSLNISLNPFIK